MGIFNTFYLLENSFAFLTNWTRVKNSNFLHKITNSFFKIMGFSAIIKSIF